ncbi:hypothetical protein H4R34_004006 [Dimargaris verticillata]|uniref:FYR N-terminal domain-containing protein n=1 Tax=Dimargaris verticillata TaxID=2761393 RepID=A0A9W8AZ01_9FUNG|nr:hypothetical protein H4R34_004006 [Dimargaris verticillata]
MPDPVPTTPAKRGPRGRKAKAAAATPTAAATPQPTPDTAGAKALSREKYQLMKQKLREVIDHNRALREELDTCYSKITRLRKMKFFLLDTLSNHPDYSNLSSPNVSDSEDDVMMDISEYDKSAYSNATQRAKSGRASRAATPKPGSTNGTLMTKFKLDKPLGAAAHTTPAHKAGHLGTPMVTPTDCSTEETPTGTKGRGTRGKRKRQTDLQDRVRPAYELEKDADGNPKLPYTSGVLTVLNLGEIVWDRDAFHNERYIWPVGYQAKRQYASMKDPEKTVGYLCTVLDSGEGPLFQVIAEDAPNEPIIATSATGAWTTCVKAANAVRHKDHSNSASGPDYFGFSNPTIAKMIQDLPNSEKCRSYIRQKYTVQPLPTNVATDDVIDTLSTNGQGNKSEDHQGSAPSLDSSSTVALPDGQTTLSTATTAMASPTQPIKRLRTAEGSPTATTDPPSNASSGSGALGSPADSPSQNTNGRVRPLSPVTSPSQPGNTAPSLSTEAPLNGEHQSVSMA